MKHYQHQIRDIPQEDIPLQRMKPETSAWKKIPTSVLNKFREVMKRAERNEDMNDLTDI